MKPANASLFFTKKFIRNVKEQRDWLNENIGDGKGYEFVKELIEFINDKIVTHPTHHMEWKWKRTKDKWYRRALFQKYVIVFKSFPNQVELLALYHQNRNAADIKI